MLGCFQMPCDAGIMATMSNPPVRAAPPVFTIPMETAFVKIEKCFLCSFINLSSIRVNPGKRIKCFRCYSFLTRDGRSMGIFQLPHITFRYLYSCLYYIRATSSGPQITSGHSLRSNTVNSSGHLPLPPDLFFEIVQFIVFLFFRFHLSLRYGTMFES